jgi:hypothetical protein
MDVIDSADVPPFYLSRQPWATWADGQIREAREGRDMASKQAFIHAGQQWSQRNGCRFAYRSAPDAPGQHAGVWFAITPK